MKISKLFTKVIAAVAVAAITVTSLVAYNPKKVQAAESVTIYQDEYATAYVYADGSGYIKLSESCDLNAPFIEIGGVPLKDIITFNDGGYIAEIYVNYGKNSESLVDILNPCANSIRVYGRGPEGLFSGAGYLHFTDETNDTYNLSIWLHAEGWHQVKYGSTQPTIKVISWNS
jgi:hypothetical protein